MKTQYAITVNGKAQDKDKQVPFDVTLQPYNTGFSDEGAQVLVNGRVVAFVLTGSECSGVKGPVLEFNRCSTKIGVGTTWRKLDPSLFGGEG